MKSLTEILAGHHTDKQTRHGYGPLYDRLLGPFRESCLPLLEVGVERGGSMRAWREAFPNSQIHGIDRSPESLIANEKRIWTHLVDIKQTAVVNCIGREFGPFFCVIDDGSHKLPDIMRAYFALRPFVAPGGSYVIEDVQSEADLQVLLAIPGATAEDLRKSRGGHDDLAVIVRC